MQHSKLLCKNLWLTLGMTDCVLHLLTQDLFARACVAPEIAKECQKSHLRQLPSHGKEYIYILYSDQVSDGRRLKSKKGRVIL